ncbi:MAG: FixH family protein [Sulfuricurvum sp.]|nr:FixH family protein [Sulfuricurvum sp.]
MINKNAGKKWPWIIAISTIIIIGFAIATIKVAINNPVEMSEYGMQSYHEYDNNVNDIINAKIEFDKKYSITFLTPQISDKTSVITYAIKDKSGKAIEDANISVVLTRPDTTKLDIALDKPTIENGIYTFKAIDLPKAGRWDIMAKITIGKNQRYYNLKTDTRYPNTIEF